VKKRFHIEIMGQEFSVLSDAGEDHVARVVKYVTDKMTEIGKSSSNVTMLNVAVLTALNIADEFLKIKGVEEVTASNLESRYERLIHLINEIR
jgi:cell division protein ZapA